MIFALISFPNLTSLKRYIVNDTNSDSVLSVLMTVENHPRIKNIKSKTFDLIFSFENTYDDVVMKVINNLNVDKSCK